MYKQYKITKNYTIAFESFNDYCKSTNSYKTGIRYYDAMSHTSIFFVLGNYRIVISRDKQVNTCNG